MSLAWASLPSLCLCEVSCVIGGCAFPPPTPCDQHTGSTSSTTEQEHSQNLSDCWIVLPASLATIVWLHRSVVFSE